MSVIRGQWLSRRSVLCLLGSRPSYIPSWWWLIACTSGLDNGRRSLSNIWLKAPLGCFDSKAPANHCSDLYVNATTSEWSISRLLTTLGGLSGCLVTNPSSRCVNHVGPSHDGGQPGVMRRTPPLLKRGQWRIFRHQCWTSPKSTLATTIGNQAILLKSRWSWYSFYCGLTSGQGSLPLHVEDVNLRLLFASWPRNDPHFASCRPRNDSQWLRNGD